MPPVPQGTKTKVCSKCKQRKPKGAFYFAKASKDGRQARCKECMKKYQRARAKRKKYLTTLGPSPLDKAAFIHLQHCRRAGMEVSESDVTPEYMLVLWTEAVRCPMCNRKFARRSGHPGSKNLDHMVPIAKGGKHMKDNVQIICRKCNLRKGDSLPVGRELSANDHKITGSQICQEGD